MTWFYWLIAVIAAAFLSWKIYGIRKTSNEELAQAHKINADLEKEIAVARAVNDELEKNIHVLQQGLFDTGIENLINEIDKERANHNESLRLKKTLKLFQSLQTDLDDLCGILLDAEQKPLDSETLLHCHALAALGSANGGANSTRYREQLTQIETECQRRALPLAVLTPSVLIEMWSKA